MARVFIDGQEGTTGLQIRERLAGRSDLELIEIAPEQRKELGARRQCIEQAEVVILCLPDDASREAVTLTGPNTRFIDASTAHRTDPDWVYGLPELGAAQRDRVRTAKLVSNPGCHATGFVLLVAPLVAAGLVPRDRTLIAHSLTGYSGGGKKLIAAYRDATGDELQGPRPYALGLEHKHLPEMQAASGLSVAPLFVPVVGPFYQGMLVSVPLPREALTRAVSQQELLALYSEHYAGEAFVSVWDQPQAALEAGFLSPTACNGTNRVELLVFGNSEQLVCFARFDNLGKGASGAAVQNLNLMLGVAEGTALIR